MSMIAPATNEVVVVTPVAPLDDHELNNHEFFTSFSRNKSEEAPPNVELNRNESASSDEYSDDSDDDRMLVKKSSMRRRNSPPTNKNVSWNENVTRQTEHRLTVERLKPAVEPLMSRQWFAPYHHEYEYYQHHQRYYQQQPRGGYYNYHHGDRYYRQEDQYSRRDRRRSHGGRTNSSNYRGRKSNRKQQSSHNPSAMLSAWIDRDN